jgi:protein gp37
MDYDRDCVDREVWLPVLTDHERSLYQWLMSFKCADRSFVDANKAFCHQRVTPDAISEVLHREIKRLTVELLVSWTSPGRLLTVIQLTVVACNQAIGLQPRHTTDAQNVTA